MAIQEYFVGFYEVPVTDAETLFAVIKDIFLRYQFQFNRCRGQCYDGAYNMSGAITGLQTRVRETEPRALYTHCAGHNLNLVSQDAMKNIPEIADFLSIKFTFQRLTKLSWALLNGSTAKLMIFFQKWKTLPQINANSMHGSCDFDVDRLNLHKNMFWDIIKDKKFILKPDLSQISIFFTRPCRDTRILLRI